METHDYLRADGTLPRCPSCPTSPSTWNGCEAKLRGDVLQRVRVLNPFLLRTAVPPITQAEGRRVDGVERLGKRVVLALEGELFLVIHLMIAGRLRWLAGRRQAAGQDDAGGVRVRRRRAGADRSRQQAARVAAPAGRSRRAARRWTRAASTCCRATSRPSRAAARREPHAQARAHRPAAVQRHRQCVFGRDPAPRAAVAGGADALARRRRDRSACTPRRATC